MVTYQYAVFLVGALGTHALVGLTLGLVVFDRPVPGMVGGLFADVDFLLPDVLGYPFVHRGITHSLILLGIVGAVMYYNHRHVAAAFSLAYLSHLLIDITTPMGIPAAYPLVSRRIYIDVGIGGHAPLSTILLLGTCVSMIAVSSGNLSRVRLREILWQS